MPGGARRREPQRSGGTARQRLRNPWPLALAGPRARRAHGAQLCGCPRKRFPPGAARLRYESAARPAGTSPGAALLLQTSCLRTEAAGDAARGPLPRDAGSTQRARQRHAGKSRFRATCKGHGSAQHLWPSFHPNGAFRVGVEKRMFSQKGKRLQIKGHCPYG